MKMSVKLITALNGGGSDPSPEPEFPLDTSFRVAAIGDAGAYTLRMIEGLVGQGLNVTDYMTNPASGLEAETNRLYPDLESNVLGERITKRNFTDNSELAQQMQESNVDFYVLAFYSHLIPPDIVDDYQGKLVNIHPSKLSEFAGVGDPLEKLMDLGRHDGGVTVHFVDEQLDHGEILGIRRFHLQYDDTSLATRARLYIQTVIPQAAELTKEVITALHTHKLESRLV